MESRNVLLPCPCKATLPHCQERVCSNHKGKPLLRCYLGMDESRHSYGKLKGSPRALLERVSSNCKNPPERLWSGLLIPYGHQCALCAARKKPFTSTHCTGDCQTHKKMCACCIIHDCCLYTFLCLVITIKLCPFLFGALRGNILDCCRCSCSQLLLIRCSPFNGIPQKVGNFKVRKIPMIYCESFNHTLVWYNLGKSKTCVSSV